MSCFTRSGVGSCILEKLNDGYERWEGGGGGVIQ